MVAAHAGAAPAAGRGAALRAALLEGAERELHAYEPVLRARDAERRRAALSAASDSPLEIARAATEVAELAAATAAQSKPALRGDAVTSVLLAEAAARAAVALVEVNLAGEAGDPRLVEGAGLARRAAAARASVVAL
jgi:formiminotetrahydrofolate cyclodeaminase